LTVVHCLGEPRASHFETDKGSRASR
jgi:hypothetical protein